MNLSDVLAIEEGATSEEGYFQSMQRAINSLDAWRLQGSMGRSMMGAIEGGSCMLGLKPTADYYGNRIPSRFEVQDGTKGSRGYVISHRGEEWADMLENLT